MTDQKDIQTTFSIRERGKVWMKGKGEQMTYIVESLSKNALSNDKWKKEQLKQLKSPNSFLRMNYYQFVNTADAVANKWTLHFSKKKEKFNKLTTAPNTKTRQSVKDFLTFNMRSESTHSIQYDMEYRFSQNLLRYYQSIEFYFKIGILLFGIVIIAYNWIQNVIQNTHQNIRYVMSGIFCVSGVTWAFLTQKMKRNIISIYHSQFPLVLYITYLWICGYVIYCYFMEAQTEKDFTKEVNFYI